MIILKYLWIVIAIIWIALLIGLTVAYILDAIDECEKRYEDVNATNVIDKFTDHVGLVVAWFVTIWCLLFASILAFMSSFTPK